MPSSWDHSASGASSVHILIDTSRQVCSIHGMAKSCLSGYGIGYVEGKLLLDFSSYRCTHAYVRHRFTAAFVQYLLHQVVFDGYRANILLNMYIWGLAKFHPLDAMSQNYPMKLPDVLYPPYSFIEFEKLGKLFVK